MVTNLKLLRSLRPVVAVSSVVDVGLQVPLLIGQWHTILLNVSQDCGRRLVISISGGRQGPAASLLLVSLNGGAAASGGVGDLVTEDRDLIGVVLYVLVLKKPTHTPVTSQLCCIAVLHFHNYRQL